MAVRKHVEWIWPAVRRAADTDRTRGQLLDLLGQPFQCLDTSALRLVFAAQTDQMAVQFDKIGSAVTEKQERRLGLGHGLPQLIGQHPDILHSQTAVTLLEVASEMIKDREHIDQRNHGRSFVAHGRNVAHISSHSFSAVFGL